MALYQKSPDIQSIQLPQLSDVEQKNLTPERMNILIEQQKLIDLVNEQLSDPSFTLRQELLDSLAKHLHGVQINYVSNSTQLIADATPQLSTTASATTPTTDNDQPKNKQIDEVNQVVVYQDKASELEYHAQESFKQKALNHHQKLAQGLQTFVFGPNGALDVGNLDKSSKVGSLEKAQQLLFSLIMNRGNVFDLDWENQNGSGGKFERKKSITSLIDLRQSLIDKKSSLNLQGQANLKILDSINDLREDYENSMNLKRSTIVEVQELMNGILKNNRERTKEETKEIEKERKKTEKVKN